MHGIVVGLLLLGALSFAGCRHLTGNFREVECGRLYRAGQMNEDRLAHVIHAYRIRTVVNLRGESADEGWWQAEKAVCERRGVAHHDEHWSAMRPPDPASLERIVRVLETGEQPVLVHCRAGVHRAATVAAVWRLMRGEPPARARGEFGFLFGDHGVGDLVDLYETSRLPFAQWAREVYPTIHAELAATRAAAGPPPRSLRAP